jgi:hypothetical protein
MTKARDAAVNRALLSALTAAPSYFHHWGYYHGYDLDDELSAQSGWYG